MAHNNLETNGEMENQGSGRNGLLRRMPPEAPIFLFYLAVTLFLTWPLILRFSTSIYGVPGDNMAGIWVEWWYRNAGSLGGTATFCPLIGFPFGTRLVAIPMEPLTYVIDRFLLLFFNEVIVYNVQMIASFLLSGVTMYYLIRYITRDRRAAFFGGIAYLVVPYHAFNSMFMGGGISCVQWMPLYILLLLKFTRKSTGKNAALLTLGAVLVAGTSVHYGMFMGVFTAAFLAGRFISRRVSIRRRSNSDPDGEKRQGFNKKTLMLSLLVLLIVIVTITPFFYLSFTSICPPGEWETYPLPSLLRIEKYANWSSASLREYFDPTYPYHVFESGISENAWKTGLNSHRALYIGWVVVTLAALGLAVSFKRRKREELPPGDSGVDAEQLRLNGETADRRLYATVHEIRGFAAAALVCFLMTLPTYIMIGSIRIPMPSKLFRYFMPWFRWHLRMGIVVSICFIVLACFGLTWIMKRMKGSSRYLVLVVLSVILALETLIVPPFVNVDFSETPEVFEIVGALPEDTAVAFYPMTASSNFETSMLMFSQRWFRKPMLNGAFDNSDGEAVRRTVYNPFNEATPGILRRFDMDYLVYFRNNFKEYRKDGMPLTPPPGLEPVDEFAGEALFGGGRIYRITARKADLVPIYLGDITAPVLNEEGETVRMMIEDGVIRIMNYSGEDRLVDLRLPLGNPFNPRRVVLTGDDKPLWLGEIETGMLVDAEIEGLNVPAEGLELRILVDGDLILLNDRDLSMFGTEYASLKVGDLEILTR